MERRARAAWTEQVRAFAPWLGRSYILTLTFARKVSDETARKAWQALLRDLSRLVGGHIRFALVSGAHADGRPHLHLLLEVVAIESTAPYACATVKPREIRKCWAALAHFGTSREQFHCETYMPKPALYADGSGGDDWIAYMCMGHENHVLSVACPKFEGQCLGRKGCPHAKGGW